MDASPQPTAWPAPKPELVNALVGSILAAQGMIPANASPGPWGMSEFDRCSGWIASALKGGDLTLAEVRDGIRNGWFHLFHHAEGVMVTEFILSPRVRALHVIAAGGSLKAMADLTPKAEHFAWMAGANWTGATGRKGWVRWLRRFGYAPSNMMTVEKAL